jgi:excisionase family DNA binding protein
MHTEARALTSERATRKNQGILNSKDTHCDPCRGVSEPTWQNGRSKMEKLTSDTTSKILNVGEVAEVMSVTRQTVKNYIYSGKLQSIKTPGGHHRIRKSDLRMLGFPVDE